MRRVLGLAFVLLLTACLPEPTGLEDRRLIRLLPDGPYIDVEEVFDVEFSSAIPSGAESAIELRKDDGSVVEVSASWSRDRRSLTLDPVVTLEPRSSYTLHVAPQHEHDGHAMTASPHTRDDSCARFTFTTR